MIDARDKSGKMLMTAQHFRFDSNSVAMKQEIDLGVLGQVYHARSWMLRRAGLVPTPGFVQKKHSGGGPCIDIGGPHSGPDVMVHGASENRWRYRELRAPNLPIRRGRSPPGAMM